MIKEEYRWGMKMNRLLNRVQKVLTEVSKSDLSSELKGDLYCCFWSYISGFCGDLEEEYPELKQRRESGC